MDDVRMLIQSFKLQRQEQKENLQGNLTGRGDRPERSSLSPIEKRYGFTHK